MPRLHSNAPTLQLITKTLCLKLETLSHLNLVRPLTSRQIETLEWVADGKTTVDICTILNLSESTIEKHLRNVRDALGVETTQQAIQKATRLNLLFAG